jgi:hypothetical protein
MPFVTGKRGSSKRVAELFELAPGPDLRLPGAASHDLPEAGELDVERNGAPATAGSLAVLPDLVDDLPQRIARSFVGRKARSRVPASLCSAISKFSVLKRWVLGAGLCSTFCNFRFGVPETGSTCGRDRFEKRRAG